MKNSFIKFSKEKPSIKFIFSQEKDLKSIKDIDALIDIDIETGKIVGVEIINMLGQAKCKRFPIKKNENDKFTLSTDDKNDMFYMSFGKAGKKGVKSLPKKCTVIANSKGEITGLELEGASS